MFKKLKRSIKAFINTWTSKDEDIRATKSVDNLMKVIGETGRLIDTLNELNTEKDQISELTRIANDQAIEYGKMIDPFFDRVLNFVLPEYLINMYKEDRTPIPNMEVHIKKFSDLRVMQTGQEVVFIYRKKIVGHIIITSWMNKASNQIQTTMKELYCIDKNPEVEYKIKNPG